MSSQELQALLLRGRDMLVRNSLLYDGIQTGPEFRARTTLKDSVASVWNSESVAIVGNSKPRQRTVNFVIAETSPSVARIAVDPFSRAEARPCSSIEATDFSAEVHVTSRVRSFVLPSE